MVSLLIVLFASIITPELDHGIFTGIYLIYQDDFHFAIMVFDTLINHFPGNPMPYVMKAGALDTYMLDHSSRDKEKDFFKTIKKGIEISKSSLKIALTRQDSSWIYFSFASLHGYSAVRKGRNKNYLSALKDAYRAISFYKKTVSLNPRLYDAYLGLGSFHFALSELPKFVKWFIAPGDYRKKALKEIKLAADSGKYTRIVAKDTYAWILAYWRPTKNAVKYAKEVVDSFPNSRSFWWTLGFTYRRKGYWWRVEYVFKRLISMTLKDQREYYLSVALVFYNLARAKYFTGKIEDAEWYLDLANLNLYFVNEDQPGFDEARKSLERLKKLIQRRKQWRKSHAKRIIKNSGRIQEGSN